ncbi:MAG TPA: amidase [Thermoleophilaceae bacterium]
MDVTTRSAVELARAVRARELTARDVVEAHIELYERFHPRVNAIVAPRFDAARADADAADARIAAAAPGDELPPLLGVPCTMKEVFAVEGMPHSSGLLARRGVRASETAPAARRMLDAGAILLGLTNTSELALWIETDNRVYGRTSNPYDPARMAGGSSGGEGAAVGCGASAIGLGTDIGGSIRIPAFCCGVFGHKPSLGLVPHTGLYPAAHGESKRLLAVGPLARRAEDLMPLMRILSGPDGEDPLLGPAELGDPAAVSFEGMRVLISEHAFLQPVSRELLAAREQAAGALAAAGARIERLSMPRMRRIVEPMLAAVSDSGNATVRGLLADEGLLPITLRSAMRRGGPHTVALRLTAMAERTQRLTPARRVRRLIEWGRDFAAELADTIGDGVLLHPPLPSVARRHGRTHGRVLVLQPTAAFNLAALPVTQVPLGIGPHGLPLGVQVAAAPGRDHVAIAAALALERAFGGWAPPSPT